MTHSPSTPTSLAGMSSSRECGKYGLNSAVVGPAHGVEDQRVQPHCSPSVSSVLGWTPWLSLAGTVLFWVERPLMECQASFAY